METAKFTEEQVWAEIDRLTAAGVKGPGYGEDELEKLAHLTLEINALKKETNTVIPAHVYQRLEIIRGIADFTGDSYKLSVLCSQAPQRRIVFCGVRFMAETAKIVNPEKEVILPAEEAGCSLAESIRGEDVRQLKKEHPGVPVVSYINTTAEVKAESDVIVTSANAPKILKLLFQEHPRVIFLPDEWMGRNLAGELGKKVGEDLIIWDGKCIVHEGFDEEAIGYYRKLHPGVKILAHSECSPALVKLVDFTGGTGDMMRYVSGSGAPSYMLVTECGLGDMARSQFPDKTFIPMCRLCPYMKATDLSRVKKAMESPEPHQVIEVPREIQQRAKQALQRMFELTSA